ncbi:MAG TPA: RIP metalloprotease RseP [Longimicrobium sp.]|nr:RIP metalloprotease RseP [Longimicrobium sp.]
MSVIALLIVIGVLVTIHEAGHFLAAKWVGIQVLRFSIGFGSKLVGFRRGETEYVISAIPLGGYVKMAGMEDDEAAEVLEGGSDGEVIDPARTFDSKPLWARTLVISAGVIMNMLFAILVYAGLALTHGETIDPTTRVAPPAPANSAGVAGEAAKVPFGARVLAVGDHEVNHRGDIDRALMELPAGSADVRIEGAPPVTINLPRGQSARVELAEALAPLYAPVIGAVTDGSPGARAGVRAGDRVLAAAGKPVRAWSEFEAEIRAHPGRPFPMRVQRGNQQLDMTVTPKAEREAGPDGKRVEVGKLGVGRQPPEYRHRRVGVLEGIGMGFTETWDRTRALVTGLRELITGEASARNMGGLITIAQVSGETAKLGISTFIAFLAFFSINLAVLNLLPIPVLDGGHLMFLAIEAVRGRPLSIETRIRLSQLGLLMVVALMVWANGNDVVRVVERYMGG